MSMRTICRSRPTAASPASPSCGAVMAAAVAAVGGPLRLAAARPSPSAPDAPQGARLAGARGEGAGPDAQGGEAGQEEEAQGPRAQAPAVQQPLRDCRYAPTAALRILYAPPPSRSPRLLALRALPARRLLAWVKDPLVVKPLPSQSQLHLLPRCLAFSAVVCLGVSCLPLPCPPGP
eukprot:SM000016S01828  [mRNA]  locus=s16:72779:73319:+ [translate_table: standard]